MVAHRRPGPQRQPDRGDRRPARACRPTPRRSRWPTALQESKLYNLARRRPRLARAVPAAAVAGLGHAAADPRPGARDQRVLRRAGEGGRLRRRCRSPWRRSGCSAPATPTAYAVYEADARALASALTGYSPAAFWCHLAAPDARRAGRRPAGRGAARSPGAARSGAVAGDASAARVRLRARRPSSATTRAGRSRRTSSAHATGSGSSQVGYRGRDWTAGNDARLATRRDRRRTRSVGRLSRQPFARRAETLRQFNRGIRTDGRRVLRLRFKCRARGGFRAGGLSHAQTRRSSRSVRRCAVPRTTTCRSRCWCRATGCAAPSPASTATASS